MNTFLTAAAFIVLVAAAAYVIHRLNIEHADRIAVHRYSAALPDRRGRGTPPPPVEPGRSESPTSRERRDHRDGGRGRFPPRRRRSPTTHHR
ncbi:hypothetical protein M2164_000368 [Streptomyces sp. SAI-208]|uniref:hypothetical protein n=1 Tax=unclassified Streptomyces TaxID=2593676 RepID=UPI002476B702|nr:MULTISPECIES: hypothetical protein [unclassified Streptomyces]MDH6513894.1 hypothetical protein [Streptomyces sp. SAI-090]MDH6546070.1 hypothetical protein [Streptomyces sp. SAI-041]MDH6604733.1 hypothetical protein [Streptomyces sp. SAI-208]MDH6622025.1 hypothetical protein [Streptomyces sp. SAI-135]